jgi:ComF family protein
VHRGRIGLTQRALDRITSLARRGAASTIRSYSRDLFNFLVPPICVACEQELERGLVCPDCYDLIRIVGSPICSICGRPTSDTTLCLTCKKNRPQFDRVRAWALFLPPVDKVIHAFKYSNRRSLARLLGHSMSRVLASDTVLSAADICVPVPLHGGRQRDRGYNQAELLGRVISEENGIPMVRCLSRTRNTPTQTKLDDAARWDNVSGAFRHRGTEPLDGRRVLLIDDVMTTGATLHACAAALKGCGAQAVYGLVCAIAPK